MEPIWLDLDALLVLHAEQQTRFGGLPGVRDRGALESAMTRPINRHAYGEVDLARLAAAYAFGVARNHPFIDGNKRMALIVMDAFLAANGVEVRSKRDDTVAVFLRLAAGELFEDELATIIQERWV
jgi:death-on-curing protein